MPGCRSSPGSPSSSPCSASTSSATACATRSIPASNRSRTQGGTPMARHIRSRLAPVLVAALTVLMAVALLAPVGPADAQRKKVLNIAAKEPDTLDPHSSTLGQSQAIARFMFRGLTRFAIKDGKVTTAEVEPDLAESWTLSPEGTIWTFKLRKGVQFHKGFDKFHAGRPQIDEVHWFDVPEDATKLIGLEKGTFDLLYPEVVTADVAEQVKRMGAVIDRRGPGGQERFYINMTKPPFDDIRVRKAFMHAIDRKAIKETMYPGGLARLATSCMPPGHFGPIPIDSLEHNPHLAKQPLVEAGHPNGFTIKNYFISKSFFYPKVLTLAQEQLKKVGIIVELQVVEHATFHENIRKNLDPFVLYGGTRITDADPWLSLFFDSKEIPDPAPGNNGTNFAHYRAMDDLLAAGRVERDVKKRATIYHEAQKRLQKDLVCLPISDV